MIWFWNNINNKINENNIKNNGQFSSLSPVA